jgi:hypothetical protein
MEMRYFVSLDLGQAQDFTALAVRGAVLGGAHRLAQAAPAAVCPAAFAALLAGHAAC